MNSSSCNKRAAFVRQQLLAIHQEETQFSCEHARNAVMENIFRSYDDTDFIQERSAAVTNLLAGFQAAGNVSSTRVPLIDGIELEPPNAGAYESCRDNEISTEILQLLKTNQQRKHFNVFGTKENNGNSLYTRSSQENATNSNASNWSGQNQNVDDEHAKPKVNTDFRTAREELIIQNNKKVPSSTTPNSNSRSAQATNSNNAPLFNYGNVKKSLGARRNVRSNFVPPIARPPADEEPRTNAQTNQIQDTAAGSSSPAIEDARLSNIDPKMIELITNEIMHTNTQMDWNEIAGLEYAKAIIKEAVVYPLLRPDIFTGLRRPPRGILLFGPPGTGKTLIGKCIASQSKSTFFTISASSLTSKWVGESEKMVRALFAVATVKQPSVVFIDEIDSLLQQRSDTEHESSRRLKTEFLVQLDGAATSDDDRILVIGATNRPQELDEAARRRFVKRLYIPLPEKLARIEILRNLLQKVNNNLNSFEVDSIAEKTDGYSGADMSSLCREASMEPIRSIPASEIPYIDVNNVRPVSGSDFEAALQNVRPSVSQMDLQQYTDWNRIYGSLQ